VRVAVLGAGVAGLTAGHRLVKHGHEVDIYERWPGLGGQAATFDLGDGNLLERYYHHLFSTDRHIRELYEELGMPDEIEMLDSTTAFFVNGRSWPFTSPLDLLRFKPLPLRARVRMGLAVLKLQRGGEDIAPYERETIKTWIHREMGRDAWSVIWGPLLRAKFGNRADDISMAWLAKKFMIRRQISDKQARTERLGYPRHSWESLFTALRDGIEADGGRVLIDRPAKQLDEDADGAFLVMPGAEGSFRAGHNPAAFAQAGDPERYDAVLATLPNDVFEQVLSPRLLERIGDEYLGRLRSIEYHTAICLVLVLPRQFTPYYWTNIADPGLPFIGLIEQTNWTPPRYYGGRHILYVTNYVERGDPLTDLDADALLRHYLPGLQKVNPDFDMSWIKDRWLFREPHAQPIVDLGYAERIPPLRTPVPGLMLANTTQVYPEDRGTNYAVRIGEEAAREIIHEVRPEEVGLRDS
jgi:protoporphyrinogen oxidase